MRGRRHEVGDHPAQLRADVLLEEVAAAAQRGVRQARAPGTTRWKTASPPPVIGSPSLKAVRKGRSKRASDSHAARLAAAAGSSGAVGTSAGKARAPAV